MQGEGPAVGLEVAGSLPSFAAVVVAVGCKDCKATNRRTPNIKWRMTWTIMAYQHQTQQDTAIAAAVLTHI